MAEITNPHDRFFREVFSRLAWSWAFIRTQLPPAIVETLALETLELRSGSFLDEELQQYFSDLLFRVRLRTGRDAYVHILLEHKSYIERFVALQLLRYKVEIWEQIRAEAKATAKQADPKQKRRAPLKFPPIFPLVVYQGTRKWTVSQHFADLIDSSEEWQPYIPDFQYAVTSVADIRETELFDTVLFRAAIRLMRHIFDPDLADKLPEIWAEFRDLAWGSETQGFLIVMLTYITSATEVDNRALIQPL
ncbi:MAG TPA: Rpn family recombination-promoting nuclease/putative transposase, partial [Caldilineaceae bacterium]|nr:Rpn family recombination-promoting nuclease/putative transposase [Caldilineaceae bacterium]